MTDIEKLIKLPTIVSRPWQPQDLINDLQLMIDEEPDNYLNANRSTLCMARDFLRDFFSREANGMMVQWISVEDRLPDELPKDGSAWSEKVRPSVDVLVKVKGLKELYTAWYSHSCKEWIDVSETHNLGDSVTHWMRLPEPPKEEC